MGAEFLFSLDFLPQIAPLLISEIIGIGIRELRLNPMNHVLVI